MTTLDTAPDPATLDRLVAALATESNREVLRYLRECSDRTVPFEDLAEHVAETQDRPRERVDLRLHHAGLPKLDQLGVLEYDAGAKVVHRQEHPVFEVEDVVDLLQGV